MLDIAIVVAYGLCLSLILVYSFFQFNLLWAYWFRENEHTKLELTELPMVTVQLPVFNEKYVVENIIDAVCKFNYPADLLDIQVLDDSTDDSFEIAEKRIQYWQEKGIQIVHIKRPVREGFKAGALKYGLERCKGEFVAIFDADFIPTPDFLTQTLGYFTPEVGVVQSRWGHSNRNFSRLTQLQAFGLDAHFTVEQVGRNALNHFINFNGTAGIWRKECIDDAGGWSAGTLTEDLDLSYRAQLAGWKFVFREDIVVEAELPMAMNALKNQQFRWTKGAAECALKNGGKVLRSDMPFISKCHGFAHLFNSSIFVIIVLSGLLSLPLLGVIVRNPEWKWLFNLGLIYLFSFFVLMAFYFTSYRKTQKGKAHRFLIDFIQFLSVSMGLSIHNANAVLEAWARRKSPFVRTPKFNVSKGDSWKKNAYLTSTLNTLNVLEILAGFGFLGAAIWGVMHEETGLLIFHGMMAYGFFFVGINSIFHSLHARKN
ncbi:MAG: cellulose synthase/poly-beta-1,6-N-acetylglucosamine synthase-like glycosyltransferase [Luteibaculaceae bacterium]|jgi:cellulose synthase/poly-beta-1,6-N-acetylglucosamine synthase-like glycosyltransferase